MSYMTGDLSNQIPTVIAMLVIVSVVGMVGNLLVVIVYVLKQDKLNATLFILVLAVSDLLCCVTLLPTTIYVEYVEWKMQSVLLCKTYYFLNNSFVPFSSLLITCIAFDRYFCLCHPFSKIITLARAKRMIATVVVFALIIGVSSTFTVRVLRTPASDVQQEKTVSNSREAVSYECTETIRINVTLVEKVVYNIVQKSQIISYILCIISVVVLYVLIYRSVSKVFRKRRQLKGSDIHREIERNAAEPAVGQQQYELQNECVDLERKTENDANLDAQNCAILHKDQSSDTKSPMVSRCSNQQQQQQQQQQQRKQGKLLTPTQAESKPNQRTRTESQRTKRPIKCLRDTTFQNLKTASMLFVIAVVYIVTFLPAMLMASNLLTLYLPIFYLYYVNNATNPIVYGFMNPNFRQDIRKLLSRQRL